jgi:SAM-dependent methyltransferase
MYRIDRCPCCLERMDETCPALMAPFIAQRVAGRPASLCALMTCPACGFRCFDHRFDDAELGRLYQGYREEDYYRTRHGWEPWYTRKINTGLSEDPRELETRKAGSFRLISGALDGVQPRRILDYGGDRGQFIPDGLGGERFVYEISGRPPLPGIRAVADLSGLEGSFDLVMICQVLEHLPDLPAQLDILHRLAGAGGVLYVEVPLERPDLRRAGAWPWGGRGLRWLAGHPWLLRCVDFYSTVARVRCNRIPPWGFLKASEHINFFTTGSLEALLRRKGFQVLACEELKIQGAYGGATALGCAARRNEPTTPTGAL